MGTFRTHLGPAGVKLVGVTHSPICSKKQKIFFYPPPQERDLEKIGLTIVFTALYFVLTLPGGEGFTRHVR